VSKAEPAVVDNDDELEFLVAFRAPADAILVRCRQHRVDPLGFLALAG
jgi:hypothetical protein